MKNTLNSTKKNIIPLTGLEESRPASRFCETGQDSTTIKINKRILVANAEGRDLKFFLCMITHSAFRQMDFQTCKRPKAKVESSVGAKRLDVVNQRGYQTQGHSKWLVKLTPRVT